MTHLTIVAMASILVAVLIVGPMFGWFIRAFFRRRRKNRVAPPQIDRCVCGYEMTGLQLARCPECGRVRGFDVSAEELGLTDEQLAKIEEKRKSRR